MADVPRTVEAEPTKSIRTALNLGQSVMRTCRGRPEAKDIAPHINKISSLIRRTLRDAESDCDIAYAIRLSRSLLNLVEHLEDQTESNPTSRYNPMQIDETLRNIDRITFNAARFPYEVIELLSERDEAVALASHLSSEGFSVAHFRLGMRAARHALNLTEESSALVDSFEQERRRSQRKRRNPANSRAGYSSRIGVDEFSSLRPHELERIRKSRRELFPAAPIASNAVHRNPRGTVHLGNVVSGGLYGTRRSH